MIYANEARCRRRRRRSRRRHFALWRYAHCLLISRCYPVSVPAPESTYGIYVHVHLKYAEQQNKIRGRTKQTQNEPEPRRESVPKWESKEEDEVEEIKL